MGLDKRLVRVYELFPNEGVNQNFFAIHTLDTLKPSQSEETDKNFSVCPYLIMQLDDFDARVAFDMLEQKRIPEFFKTYFHHYELPRTLIKIVENPSADKKFIEQLISSFSSGKRDKEQRRAKDLLLLFGDTSHIPLLLERFELTSELYYRFEKEEHSLEE
jgi:hypothetical protein